MAHEIDFMPGYTLHAGQKRFVNARRKFRHRRIVTGRQWGKTDMGAAEAVLYSTIFKPGGTGAIVGPTFPLALVARDRFNAICPYELRTWNGTERRWTIRADGGTESIIQWVSLHDPDAPRGLVLDWVWLDECAMYADEAVRNLRPTLAVREGESWGTTTPKGMNWLEKESRQDDVFFVHGESIDNPMYPHDEWEKMIARYGYDSPFFKQEYRGLFQAFVGQAIPSFDRTKHSGPYPHVKQWPVYSAWDFGFVAPTVRLWAQRNPESDQVRLIGCRLWTETERTEILLPKNMALNGIPANGAIWHAIDPSGASGRAPEASDRGWRDAMEDLGWDVRWTRKIGETRGLNIIRRLVNQGLLVIDESCEGAEMLIQAFELAELDDNPEKDRLKENQHPHVDILDGVRYLVGELFGDLPEIETKVI